MHKIERLPATRSFCVSIAGIFTTALLSFPVLAQNAPKLIPGPRELHAAALVPIASATVVVPGPHANSEALFTAHDLPQELAADGIQMAPSIGAPDLAIDLLHRDAPQAEQLLT